jgi:U6 snRNA-associated Sm-like protein LSm7
VLKGYDALMNLVLDEVEELLRGALPYLPIRPTCWSPSAPLTDLMFFSADDEGNEMTRPLGLVVVRGTLLVVISPVDGSEVIENPFLQAEEE